MVLSSISGGIGSETVLRTFRPEAYKQYQKETTSPNTKQQKKEEKTKALSNASEDEKSRENGDAKVVVIRKAGHHVYLDGADHFNSVMEDEMKDVESRERRLGFMK